MAYGLLMGVKNMDLVTHGVIGLALGSLTGGPSLLQNPMALGSFIGSIMPDGDIIFQLNGNYCYLKNHRSASHSVPIAAGLSFVVSAILSYIFSGYSIWSIFAWTFLGYLVHMGLDLFNSYGASVLWPFKRKKYKSALLMSFDPIIFLAFIAIYIGNRKYLWITAASIVILVFYLLFRYLARKRVRKSLKQYFNLDSSCKIVVLPSALRFFKWDFIIYKDRHIITGQVSFIRNKAVVRNRFVRSETHLNKFVMDTPLGKFFKEFSPYYHIQWKREGENYCAIISDLRYFIKGNYLYNGAVLFNSYLEPIKYIFKPYNLGKKIKIPI